MSQSGQSLYVDHLYANERSRVKKMNGPEVKKWTVQKYKSGRSKSMKVNGPQV